MQKKKIFYLSGLTTSANREIHLDICEDCFKKMAKHEGIRPREDFYSLKVRNGDY